MTWVDEGLLLDDLVGESLHRLTVVCLSCCLEPWLLTLTELWGERVEDISK